MKTPKKSAGKVVKAWGLKDKKTGKLVPWCTDCKPDKLQTFYIIRVEIREATQ